MNFEISAHETQLHLCIRTLKRMLSHTKTLEKTLRPQFKRKPKLLEGNPIQSFRVYYFVDACLIK